jgi:ferredoxin
MSKSGKATPGGDPNTTEPPAGAQEHWVVEVDGKLCSLCECCARDCPSGALQSSKDGDRLTLTFQSSLCTACAAGAGCEATCPEEAISRRDGGTSAPEDRHELVDGQLIVCSYCNESFGTVRKLERVASKRSNEAPIQSELCPLCRRKHLVVKFIDEKRRPDAKAEYRSTYEILRRANKLIPGEKPR